MLSPAGSWGNRPRTAMAPAPDHAVWFETTQDGDRWELRLGGAWTVTHIGAVDQAMRALHPAGATRARIDLGDVQALDTAGAWLVYRTRKALLGIGIETGLVGTTAAQTTLIEAIAKTDAPGPVAPPRPNALIAVLARMGAALEAALEEGRNLLGFLGVIVVTLGRTVRQPSRLRLTALVANMEQTGLNAIPIVSLISFLIGVVLAYQGVVQLRQFGAEIFTVNLVGVSVLREVGILLTAIVVAGRSGSAFTAQIGTMKINQEVDALQTLGLDVIEVLVLPRLLALVLTLPLLVFVADIMGLFGGALLTILLIDLSIPQYLKQLQEALTAWTFGVGMIKAPVFAFLIGMVGCYKGLKVSGSAESVGRLTTQSVVESIFLVIVFDAAFSILFSYIGV
ncbi:MAG: MlaE family lipid ABC transporter permease subunit [Alphaproteobacteria bacterium]|nr:MlaE family lipid ABC transporter permease subunit [Alphaproteobacteria bacterium]